MARSRMAFSSITNGFQLVREWLVLERFSAQATRMDQAESPEITSLVFWFIT